MKHMNPKLARLLNEGFSITTLEKLTSKQIGVLYEKVKKSKVEIENPSCNNVAIFVLMCLILN